MYGIMNMMQTILEYAEEATKVWAMDYTSFGMKGGETIAKIQLDAYFTGKDIDSETGLT